jgi:hypothetical protein
LKTKHDVKLGQLATLYEKEKSKGEKMKENYTLASKDVEKL